MIILVSVLAGLVWVVTRYMDAAQDGKSAWRRFGWSRKIDKRLIDHLTDPRESAAILLVQIAAYEGEITNAQREVILAEMSRVLSVDKHEAEGFYGYARLAVGEINDAANQLSKILKIVMENCTLDEMKQLIEMLEIVAEVDGAPSDRQRMLIAAIRKALSLNAPHSE